MTTTIIPKNSDQKSPDVAINDSSLVIDSSGITIYTCPAGKVAVGRVTNTLNGYGSHTKIRMRAGGSKITNFTQGTDLTDSIQKADFTLNAGEELNITGNGAGADGKADWAVTIRELPA